MNQITGDIMLSIGISLTIMFAILTTVIKGEEGALTKLWQRVTLIVVLWLCQVLIAVLVWYQVGYADAMNRSLEEEDRIRLQGHLELEEYKAKLDSCQYKLILYENSVE